MASTASTILRLELMATGENGQTWGTKTNLNKNMLESAIAGTTALSVTGGTVTLSNVDYTNDQAKKAVLDVSGVLGSDQIIVIPNASKTYKVFNRTSGAFTLTIKTAAGSGIVLTQSTVCEVYCDGSNVVRFATPMTNFGTGAPATASGAAAAAVSVTPAGNLSSTNVQAGLVELQGDIDATNAALPGYQPLDADLTNLGSLAKTKGNVIAGDGSAWSTVSVGTNGFAMIADSTQATGMKFAALIAAATVALFYQAAAPVGWTASDVDSNKAIRIVSGVSGLGGAAGGATNFTSVFGARTIAQNNLPNVALTGTTDSSGAHTHTLTNKQINDALAGGSDITKVLVDASTSSSSEVDQTTPPTTSSNGAHTHSFTTSSLSGGGAQQTMDFAVQYISVIKCAKDVY